MTVAVVVALLVLTTGLRLRPRLHRSPRDGAGSPDEPAVGTSARRRGSGHIPRWATSAHRRRRRRLRRHVERTWPDAIELLVHALEAGLTPRLAIAHLARTAPVPVRDGFAAVVHRTARGQPVADALHALTETVGPPAGPVVDVIATSERYGLPLAPVLDQLARDARDARRRLDQAAARKLPVRLSFPLVTCTLPSFVLLAIAPAVIAALSSLGGTAW